MIENNYMLDSHWELGSLTRNSQDVNLNIYLFHILILASSHNTEELAHKQLKVSQVHLLWGGFRGSKQLALSI